MAWSCLLQTAFDNVCHNLKWDGEYLEASKAEAELCRAFENLALPKEQKETIRQWTEAIHAQNTAYTMVVFRMTMQFCFSLLVQLADLR